MKATKLIGSLGVLYAMTAFGPAIAKEWVEPAEGFVSSKTRAEVQAGLANETAAERLVRNLEYVPPPQIAFGNSRFEVQAALANETAAERQARNLEYVPPIQIVSGKARAEVRDELAEAVAGGTGG